MAVAFSCSRAHFVFAVTLLLVAQACVAADLVTQVTFRPPDPENQIAFDRLYNLDYDAAVQDFEKVLARHPGDPYAVNHLLTAILVRELYRTGAMNTGEYANDSFVGQVHRPPDPTQTARIKQLVQQAQKLE